MGRIHLLDKAVAELIAAGEVVERPASIVKELVENSIDAGAASITVEIKNGGISYIRITDNGSGISKEDVAAAFMRHATSKVRLAEDLEKIRTLGFRGEALASIAAMCRVELLTKTPDAHTGVRYTISGMEEGELEECGCPNGTTILVRDVFFNTPARMKFLKKDVAEGNSVAQVVEKAALANPGIAFKFIRDQQIRLQTSGNGDLLSAVYSVYGREFADGLLPVDYTHEGVRVSGYVSKPESAKASRAFQTFFINARYVRTRTGAAAVEEACKGKLMGGRFPICILNLELPEDSVDVNVHPAKIEVRFVNERPVFNAVYFAVKTALSLAETPILETRGAKSTLSEPGHTDQGDRQTRMSAKEFHDSYSGGQKPPLMQKEHALRPGDFKKPLLLGDSPLEYAVAGQLQRQSGRPGSVRLQDSSVLPAASEENASPSAARRATLNSGLSKETGPSEPLRKAEWAEPVAIRYVGEVFGTYILMDKGESLLLVDKHAAHERLLYERLKANISYGNRQLLLAPVTVLLPMEVYTAAIEQLDVFASLGFLVEDFGGGSLIVRETPIELVDADIENIIIEIGEKLKRGSKSLGPNQLERLYYSIACKSAVRSHDNNQPFELESLVRMLNENPQITHCPHGRPVSVELSRREMEKMFGRLG